VVAIPLVFHGGSGIADNNIRGEVCRMNFDKDEPGFSWGNKAGLKFY